MSTDLATGVDVPASVGPVGTCDAAHHDAGGGERAASAALKPSDLGSMGISGSFDMDVR